MQVGAIQQPRRLREALAVAGVSHRQIVRGDIVGVQAALSPSPLPARAVATTTARPILFFCRIKAFKVTGIERDGDGQPMASNVKMNRRLAKLIGQLPNCNITIENVKVICNGAIHLVADRETKIVPTSTYGQEKQEDLLVSC